MFWLRKTSIPYFVSAIEGIVAMKTLAVFLGIAGAFFPFVVLIFRQICLRPSKLLKWRNLELAPLNDTEILKLHRWQKLDLILFFSFVSMGIISAVLTWTKVVSDQVSYILYCCFLLIGFSGLFHHFLRKCPRCKMNLGIQRNLLLPKYCLRCSADYGLSH